MDGRLILLLSFQSISFFSDILVPAQFRMDSSNEQNLNAMNGVYVGSEHHSEAKYNVTQVTEDGSHGHMSDLHRAAEDANEAYNNSNEDFEIEQPKSVVDAMQSFTLPEGFVADFVPPPSKNRSIIFDFGVKVTHISSNRTIWLCLCSQTCQSKAAKGIGISIKG
jgi:hypothetical protein